MFHSYIIVYISLSEGNPSISSKKCELRIVEVPGIMVRDFKSGPKEA